MMREQLAIVMKRPCIGVRVAVDEMLGARRWEYTQPARVALIGLRGAGKSTLGQLFG